MNENPYRKEWERITETPYSSTDRLEVWGGWLVRDLQWGDSPGLATALCFVSDPEHQWRIK